MDNPSNNIGIYFGEDHLIIARVKGNSIGVLENLDNEKVTPAVLYMTEDHEPIVGTMARQYGMTERENTVYSIQQLIGRNFNDPGVQRIIGQGSYHAAQADNGEIAITLQGRNYSIIDLAAFLFTSIKHDAESAMDQAVAQAIITIPAYFSKRQRGAVREAAQKAGITVMDIISETTAVILAYGINIKSSQPTNILVYDLASRTFDVTILKVAAGRFSVLSRTGDMHLGGDDFDQKIVDWMIEQARMRHHIDGEAWRHNSQIMYKLKNHAEQAKFRLTKTTQVKILIPGITMLNGSPLSLNYDLSRDQFNAMIHLLIDYSLDLVNEALEQANLDSKEIDAALIVGSGAGIPLVLERLEAIFGKRVRIEPDLLLYAKAIGAAIQTRIAPDNPLSQPEIAANAEPVPSTPQPQPEEVEKAAQPAPAISTGPLLCSCGVLNPAGRTICCFCGKSLTVSAESDLEIK